MDSIVKIDSGIWSEPWFERIPSLAKLVYLFLVSNPKVLYGRSYEITQKRISEETLIPPIDVDTCIEILKQYGKIKTDDKFKITLVD